MQIPFLNYDGEGTHVFEQIAGGRDELHAATSRVEASP